jgi:hypothetical protein
MTTELARKILDLIQESHPEKSDHTAVFFAANINDGERIITAIVGKEDVLLKLFKSLAKKRPEIIPVIFNGIINAVEPEQMERLMNDFAANFPNNFNTNNDATKN